MAYHMPRVVYWAQQRSVAFFPTPYFNQIAQPPFAEYVMLHGYLLTGTDRLVNFGQWLGMAGSLGGVAALARTYGLDSRAQWMAALFCATLPNGILQASGAKNDYLLSLWLVLTAYFLRAGQRWSAGLATALAVGTKATAWLFLPGVFLLARRRPHPTLVLCILALNGPQFARNWRTFGHLLGPESARADEPFRWRNDAPGWRPTVSNLLRNASEQLGARTDRWNSSVFDAVITAHAVLGIDPQDPGTTWPWARFTPPQNANHEANANNRWHLLLIVLVSLSTLWRRQWRTYAAGLALALLAFCFYLKWQPFLSRLFLPLFVLAAPLAAWFLSRLRPPMLACACCVFLITGARLPLLENWTRPLRGSQNVFETSRDERLFADMKQWNNRASYLQAVEQTVASGCLRIGIDISRNHLEYPYQALVRARLPAARFEHVSGTPAPGTCAVFCPDCAGVPEKERAYSAMPRVDRAGRFLLYFR